MKDYKDYNKIARKKLDIAKKHLYECQLCPRNCRINRFAGQKGWCGAGADARYYMAFVHYGEEPELVPSQTIYLTGCNLDCLFCKTAPKRESEESVRLTPSRLNTVMNQGRWENARNINFVGGEPMANLPALISLFSETEHLLPIVWNTNLYCSHEALFMTEGLPDMYLAEMKFGNNDCGYSLSQASDYWDIVRERLKELYAVEGADKIIIRHQVLPGHLECCTIPLLKWIASEMIDVKLSLKTDYIVTPSARKDKKPGRFLKDSEILKAEKSAYSMGLNLVQRENPTREIPETKKTFSGTRLKSETDANIKITLSPTREVDLALNTGSRSWKGNHVIQGFRKLELSNHL